MTPVGYTGKPYDGVTSLYYFGARFYDPAIQRFVTEDAFSGVKEDPSGRVLPQSQRSYGKLTLPESEVKKGKGQE